MRTHRHRVKAPIAAVVALVGTCGVSVALADPPTAPDATATAAPAASATTAPAVSAPATPAPANASATANADKAASASAQADAAAVEKRLTNAGYRPRMRNGTKVWCKREAELGSRLGGQEICGTPEELRMVVQQNQDAMKDIQKLYDHSGN